MKQITKLPQPPTTAEPQNFDDRADAFVGALPAFVTETNELAAEVEESLQTVQTLKENADASKQSAQTSAQTASEAKEAAARSASEAESSAQAAAQIKTQTQEIKQSAQEALAAIAAAAQSSAQAARQSEQAAEQTKTELQTATNTLEQMKSIVKDGFIDDSAQSETKTYSSHKIVELNEALSADVTQEIKRVDESVRADAIKGNLNLPSPFESDLAMWDYMEKTNAYCKDETPEALFLKGWALGRSSNFAVITVYDTLNAKMKSPVADGIGDPYYCTVILDDANEAAAVIKGSNIYTPDGRVYLKTANKDGAGIDVNRKVASTAAKFILYILGSDNVAVFGLSGDGDVLKYLYKASVPGIEAASYKIVFYDLLVIKKSDEPSKIFKITNSGISEVSGITLPANHINFAYDKKYAVFYRDFLLYKSSLYRTDGTIKSFPVCGEVMGFLGGTPYLLQRARPTSGVFYYNKPEDGFLYFVYDIERGERCVLLPAGEKPVSAYVENGYAYIVFARSVVKIPAKYLTGANYKGE